MTSAQTTYSIIQDWINKGDEEKEDYFNKFICYWISFNAYYVHKTQINDDTPALNELKKNPEINAAFIKLFSSEKQSTIKKLENIIPIKDMRIGKTDLEKTITDWTFTEVIDVLYKIRCNLFHGSKGGNRKRDVYVINNSTPVLELIVKDFIKSVPLEY